MRPKVTIVTPTYNRANLICETIESILAQTWKDFELLIIDDGSTDETEQTVKPYLSDPRVRYFYKPNGGEPSAVNEGWRRASGEYFTQINSDDPALPNLLKEMCAAMDAIQRPW
jgi:glycosyltransferase involved in cell wall biosynthesis